MGATRLYCMIVLILAGAKFLSLAMGYTGIPRELAEWIGVLGLSPFALIVALCGRSTSCSAASSTASR